jgi:hypothetical protein
MNDPISRKRFLKSAAVGAAAASGIASADYFPPGPGPDPDGNVVEKKNKVIVYPTGDSYADYLNLKEAISDYPEYPSEIHLMDKSKTGEKTSFVLPAEYDPDCPLCEGYMGIELTRDVKIIGQGKDAKVEGGMIAFASYDDYSLSIKNLNFVNQEFSAVYGYFDNLVFKNNNVSVNPMPPPSPDVNPMPPPEPTYGLFLQDITNYLEIKNCSITNLAGIVCKGANDLVISNNIFLSTMTAIYLANVSNAKIKDNKMDLYNMAATYNSGFANIIIDQGSSSNEIKNGKISGDPYFGILILGEDNPTNNDVFSINMKKFGGNGTIAAVAIDPLLEGNVSNTIVKAGPGSVSVNPMPPPSPEVNPMPPPKEIVLDNGTDSKIDKKFQVNPPDIYLPPIFYDSLSSFRYKIEDPFPDEGDLD